MSKIILITGVSSGFGKCTAQLLADKGYKVYGTSRRAIEHDARITVISMDVTNQQSVQQGVSSILQKEGHIDVLINNAGMGIAGAIEESLAEEVKLQMDTNFYGVLYTIQSVLPSMRNAGKGIIINISSIGGLVGMPFQGFYAASKFAVEGLSQSLYMELKQFNINVVLVNPGDFNTQFTANRKMIVNANEKSPYRKSFAQTVKVFENDEHGGLKPIVLANKILSIVENEKPGFRYVVSTLEQKLAVFLKNILPDSWFYKILGSHYDI